MSLISQELAFKFLGLCYIFLGVIIFLIWFQRIMSDDND